MVSHFPSFHFSLFNIPALSPSLCIWQKMSVPRPLPPPPPNLFTCPCYHMLSLDKDWNSHIFYFKFPGNSQERVSDQLSLAYFIHRRSDQLYGNPNAQIWTPNKPRPHIKNPSLSIVMSPSCACLCLKFSEIPLNRNYNPISHITKQVK